MEREVIYCTACGAENKAVSNFCLDCGEELIALHPVESEGGMVLTLACWGCGGLITIYKDGRFLACEQCGLVHRIVNGVGYLTIQPAPGETVPIEDEIPADQFMSEDDSQPAKADMKDSIHPPTPPVSRKEELSQRQKQLEDEINTSEALIKKAKAIRKQGRILLGAGVVVLLLLWNFTGGYIVAPGFILMLIAGLLLFTGGIIRSITGKNKLNLAGSKSEIEAKKAEIQNLERQLAELDEQDGQDHPAKLPNDGFSIQA